MNEYNTAKCSLAGENLRVQAADFYNWYNFYSFDSADFFLLVFSFFLID